MGPPGAVSTLSGFISPPWPISPPVGSRFCSPGRTSRSGVFPGLRWADLPQETPEGRHPAAPTVYFSLVKFNNATIGNLKDRRGLIGMVRKEVLEDLLELLSSSEDPVSLFISLAGCSLNKSWMENLYSLLSQYNVQLPSDWALFKGKGATPPVVITHKSYGGTRLILDSRLQFFLSLRILCRLQTLEEGRQPLRFTSKDVRNT